MQHTLNEQHAFEHPEAQLQSITQPQDIYLEYINEYDFPEDPGYIIIDYNNSPLHPNTQQLAEHYQLPTAIIHETLTMLRALGYLPRGAINGTSHYWHPPHHKDQLSSDLLAHAQQDQHGITIQQATLPIQFPGQDLLTPTHTTAEKAHQALHHFFVRLKELLGLSTYCTETGQTLEEAYQQLFPKNFFGKMSIFDFGTHIRNWTIQEVLNHLLAGIDAKHRFTQGEQGRLYQLLPASGLQIYSKKHPAPYPVDIHAPLTTIPHPNGQGTLPLYLSVGNGYGDSQMLLMCTASHPGIPIFAVGVRFYYHQNGELHCSINTCQLKSKNTTTNEQGELQYTPDLEPIAQRPMETVTKYFHHIHDHLQGHPVHYLIEAWRILCHHHHIHLSVDDPHTNFWMTEHQDPSIREHTLKSYPARYAEHGIPELHNDTTPVSTEHPIPLLNNLPTIKRALCYGHNGTAEINKGIRYRTPAFDPSLQDTLEQAVLTLFPPATPTTPTPPLQWEEVLHTLQTQVQETIDHLLTNLLQYHTGKVIQEIHHTDTSLQRQYLQQLRTLTTPHEQWESTKTILRTITHLLQQKTTAQSIPDPAEKGQAIKALNTQLREAEKALGHLLLPIVQHPDTQERIAVTASTLGTRLQLHALNHKIFPYSLEELLTHLTQ